MYGGFNGRSQRGLDKTSRQFELVWAATSYRILKTTMLDTLYDGFYADVYISITQWDWVIQGNISPGRGVGQNIVQ